jgi:hypothetical protein
MKAGIPKPAVPASGPGVDLGVRVPRRIKGRLKRLAKRQGLSLSDSVLWALNDFLNDHEYVHPLNEDPLHQQPLHQQPLHQHLLHEVPV